MDKRPIGVFDTGVGGLTTVKELHRILPYEDIVYFGDTGRVPYGTRSKETIRRYAIQDIKFLCSFDVKAIVAACGTVSATITDNDIAALGVTVPYMGVVMPATRAACGASSHGRIGVIATTAAIRSGAYGKALRMIQPSAKLFGNAAPLLVPLVENGMTAKDNKITRLVLEQYLAPLIAENIDTLILGCTHYPLLIDIIDDILESKVQLIDAGAATARELHVTMCESGLLNDGGDQNEKTGTTIYKVTDSVENFSSVARNFLADDVEAFTEYVDVDIITAL